MFGASASTAKPLFGQTAATSSTPSLFGNTSVSTSTPGTGSIFGSATTTSSTGTGLSLLGSKTTPQATGTLFGGATTSTAPNLFGSTATSGTTPNLFGNTASSGGLFGAKSTASVAPTLNLTANTANTTGGLFGATAPATTTAALTITPFASSVTSTSKGLGGVDPQKTSLSGGGDGSINGKSSDSKAMKETIVPQEISTIVEKFKKYIKAQKTVQEDIARVVHKPIFRVQDDVKQLKQLLAIVSNGLQRNAGSIEKLKQECSLELKNVEIAQRTKDTPPGLQYENTAPMEYFQHLIEDFDLRMQLYRQQIEAVEQHFMSLQDPAVMTPHELTSLLRKIHETFIAVAAQLQVVHEEVKTQREHLLSYRKVFQGDSTDVFELKRRNRDAVDASQLQIGPTPFSGVSNAAALAMASAMNRSQQPSGAPPTLGLGSQQNQTFGTGIGFGSNQSTAFGAQPALATPFSSPAVGGAPVGVATPFNLQKPPVGNKRGKAK